MPDASMSHQRVTAALELRQPDRVPTFDLMMDSISYEILGMRPGLLDRLLGSRRAAGILDRTVPLIRRLPVVPGLAIDRPADFEAGKFARAGAAAAAKIGFDSAVVNYYPVFRLQDSNTMHDIFGRSYRVTVDRRGFLVLPTYREGLIKSPEHWKSWDKHELLGLPEKCNRVLAPIQAEFGGELFIFGLSSAGLFESTWEPMGFENFVIATRKEKEFIRRMIRFQVDLNCSIIEAFADAGLPGYLFADDLAYKSGPMLNPGALEELFGDGYRRITETAHSLGMKVVIHSCGNTSSLLGWLADCGFDGIHPLEPSAGMELAAAKEEIGDRMCLVGNIDVTRILVNAPREEVFEAVRMAVADAGDGGGFLLAAAHSHEDVSVERVRWMLEAAGRYGRYPLDA